MGEFNEFSEYVLSILGEPVAQGVEKFKQLRFKVLKRIIVLSFMV